MWKFQKWMLLTLWSDRMRWLGLFTVLMIYLSLFFVYLPDWPITPEAVQGGRLQFWRPTAGGAAVRRRRLGTHAGHDVWSGAIWWPSTSLHPRHGVRLATNKCRFPTACLSWNMTVPYLRFQTCLSAPWTAEFSVRHSIILNSTNPVRFVNKKS